MSERTSPTASGYGALSPTKIVRAASPIVPNMASAAPLDGVLQLDAVHKDLVHESFTCDTRDHEDHTCATSHSRSPSRAPASTRGLGVSSLFHFSDCRAHTSYTPCEQVLRHDVRRAGRDGSAYGVRRGELTLGGPLVDNRPRLPSMTPTARRPARGRPAAPGGALGRPSPREATRPLPLMSDENLAPRPRRGVV